MSDGSTIEWLSWPDEAKLALPLNWRAPRCIFVNSTSDTGRFVGKKDAGRMLDGREHNEFPG